MIGRHSLSCNFYHESKHGTIPSIHSQRSWKDRVCLSKLYVRKNSQTKDCTLGRRIARNDIWSGYSSQHLANSMYQITKNMFFLFTRCRCVGRVPQTCTQEIISSTTNTFSLCQKVDNHIIIKRRPSTPQLKPALLPQPPNQLSLPVA